MRPLPIADNFRDRSEIYHLIAGWSSSISMFLAMAVAPAIARDGACHGSTRAFGVCPLSCARPQHVSDAPREGGRRLLMFKSQ